MSNRPKIDSPKVLTKKIHQEILESLRSVLKKMNETESLDSEIGKIRIRNWLFLYEEGVPTVDIIIDKGYSEADVAAQVVPRHANTSLSFDECTQIHKFLLASDALEAFSDHVDIRVGTPGSEPTLYDDEDYQASIGDMVKIETWEPCEGRSKFTMILVDIFTKEGNSRAVLAEGGHRFEIPLNNIKNAFVLPFHPASKSMKMARDAAKKKALHKSNVRDSAKR